MARSFVAFVCIVGASSLRPENNGQMSSTDLAPQEILSSAQQLTDSMLQKRNATGHLSDEDAELCKNIINMIQASMYTSLRDAHQTDQTALTEAVDAIEFCNADIVERQNAKGDIGRLEHVAAGQQLTQTSLQSDYDTKKVADDAALSDLEGHMRSTSEFHQCVGVPVHRTTIAFDAFYEENAYVEEFLVKREEYRAKRGAQQLTKAALDEAARQLESSTASLHAEYCAWEAVLKSACESFEECYEKTEADLSALINSAKAREAARAEAYRTGEIVIANINYLLDQGAAPEADMEVDTSEFNLDIPATPEMATCDQGRLTDSRWNPPISCGNKAPNQEVQWIKGGRGEVCGDVCGAVGKTCNGAKPSTLTTNDLVAEAFAKAGYTCKSFHVPRDYDGAPFSKETGKDDCAPFLAGSSKESSCTANAAGHHWPLCACE